MEKTAEFIGQPLKIRVSNGTFDCKVGDTVQIIKDSKCLLDCSSEQQVLKEGTEVKIISSFYVKEKLYSTVVYNNRCFTISSINIAL